MLFKPGNMQSFGHKNVHFVTSVPDPLIKKILAHTVSYSIALLVHDPKVLVHDLFLSFPVFFCHILSNSTAKNLKYIKHNIPGHTGPKTRVIRSNEVTWSKIN